jgi:hypothetical protein
MFAPLGVGDRQAARQMLFDSGLELILDGLAQRRR